MIRIFLSFFFFFFFQYQIDADTAAVGEQGEIDFKEDAKFAQHLKEKGEAVSEFAKTKSLSQQRQYLPIYSVREELLQVRTCCRALISSQYFHLPAYCFILHALNFIYSVRFTE